MDLQYLVRSADFIIQTHLKMLQWNDAADDTRTIYVQKLSAKYLPQFEGAGDTGPDVRFGSMRLSMSPDMKATPRR